MWVLVSVLIAVLVASSLSPSGSASNCRLSAPMNRLIESISVISPAAIWCKAYRRGRLQRNVGQLAENLRHMQSELDVRTVGDVRNGANAIHSGASARLRWATISSRTEQAASLEETAASKGTTDRHRETERRKRPSASHRHCLPETAQKAAK
ncbi:hypothetical protein KCP71_02580 [Salmonella enterica subsp. enterica]|nr:hypothetical protein KCP71_02580 [Salmonella enterica subsp. enterica]